MKWKGAAAFFTILLAPSLALASVVYDLQSGGTASTSTGSGYNTQLNFNLNGLVLKASGVSNTGSGGKLEKSQVLRYSTGLGVCNQSEGTNCGNPEHQVDNNNNVDFVLFEFNKSVEFKSITIDPYGEYDRDVTFFVADLSDPTIQYGTWKLSDLSTYWGIAAADINNSKSGDPLTISLSGLGNRLLFGAYSGNSQSFYGVDRFKIKTLEVRAIPSPEPSSLALLGSGLVAAGFIRRRKK